MRTAESLLFSTLLLLVCAGPLCAESIAPKLITRIDPVVPKHLVDARQKGSAVLEFIVTKSGDVVQVRIISATDKDFGIASAKALLLWKFKPGSVDGRKTNQKLRVPIYFDCSQPEGKAEPNQSSQRTPPERRG